jgi:hypothetical protein
MKLERSKVDHPLWRKKVDKSLFEYNGTTIPGWACDMWDIKEKFQDTISKKDKNSAVEIYFGEKIFPGWVTVAKKQRKTPAYRLWFSEDLSEALKHTYVMSYMRMLEQALNPDSINIEEEIPFWEFLDIEYARESSVFHFVAYYYQKPSFPHLFNRIIGSPALSLIDDEIHEKEEHRIHKQDWNDRSELPFELGAENVIYVLADTEKKWLYVGEAKNLVRRLSQRYSVIPNWDKYRYDVLPKTLEPFRVTLERMLIRSYATLFGNNKGIMSFDLSKWKLVNEKIDK